MIKLAKPVALHRQGGWTVQSVIFGLLIFTVLVKVAYVVAPPIYDNILVQRALRDVAERNEARLNELRKTEVERDLSNFYNLNGVRNKVILESLEVDRRKERTIIKVDYEVRTPFFMNADVVLTFKNHLDTSKPDECCKATEDTKRKPSEK